MTKKKILVVEDNLINQELLVDMIERTGFDADIAENGQEALNLLQTNIYDLIFMDLQMPIMDGFEATREIRTRQMKIPVVALTANAMQEDRRRCEEAGMDDYLSKPFELKDIEVVLAKFLG